MVTTITHSTGTVVPAVIETYEAEREVRTIVHDIPNRSNPDISLRAAGLRRGSLECRFATQAEAAAALSVLSVPQVLTIANPVVPFIAMSFVVGPEGEKLRLSLIAETKAWWLTVPFVEVTP